jgi:hypothetical protein
MSSRDLKGSGLTDRLSAAADAKAALLAKMKPKPTAIDPLFEQRAAMRAAELREVRAARADEREAARQAAAAARASDNAGDVYACVFEITFFQRDGVGQTVQRAAVVRHDEFVSLGSKNRHGKQREGGAEQE